MEDFRSKSYRDARSNTQIEQYHAGAPAGGVQDLRYLTTSYSFNSLPPPYEIGGEVSTKKGKGGGFGSFSKGWSFNDSELQRRKRVVGYKVFSVEQKMKRSFRKSVRWIKDVCSLGR